ncbi:MAG TPA: serine/threonine-protein kinase [Acidobacteriota bacterium]|nr:serine/threonine-protein kinase [Acidobacteriota bacterium]
MRFGRYEVKSDIGKGAMGVVYKCRDPQIGRTVAIKTVSLHQSATGFDEGELRDRLLKEARAAGILSHPNIVTIYDVGEEEDSIYIVMEYLEGTPLSDILLQSGAVSFDTVLAMAEQVGSALDYAHGQGIVHRDVKPANIMQLADGRMKLMDFGIAWVFDTSATQKGVLVGSPAYMSPEQIDDAELTGRSDLYALGAVVFEMLTGKRPFSGKNINALILAKFENSRPALAELNPRLPAALEFFFDKALAVDPARRFRTAGELVRELKTAFYSRSMPFTVVTRPPAGGPAPPRGQAASVKPPTDEQDAHLAETIVFGDAELNGAAREKPDDVEIDTKPPPAEPDDSTQRFGITTSVIKAYTSGVSKQGREGDKPAGREDTDTGIIRKDVEQELAGKASREGAIPREADLKRLVQQIDKLHKRLVGHPGEIDTIVALGRAYREAGRFSEAIVQFRRALKLDYERTDALDLIADIYNKLGMKERAYSTWSMSEWLNERKVGRLAKENHFKLGKRLERERLLRGAIEVWEETAVLEPRNAEVWRTLAHYYLKLQDYQKAIRAHRELLKIEPSDTKAVRNLAVCYQNSGEYAQALEQWRKSLETDAEGSGARKARKNIQALEKYLRSSQE